MLTRAEKGRSFGETKRWDLGAARTVTQGLAVRWLDTQTIGRRQDVRETSVRLVLILLTVGEAWVPSIVGDLWGK
jgi:hypothetical protein